MIKTILCLFSIAIASTSFAQKKFAQLDMELPTPNEYRNAAGAPGHAYFQQQADYKMNLVLDDDKQKLSGTETITYTNNFGIATNGKLYQIISCGHFSTIFIYQRNINHRCIFTIS